MRKREISEPTFQMPLWLLDITKRITQIVEQYTKETFCINECNAISYKRREGHELEPHVDDRKLSTSIIANLSLCGDCIMTYSCIKPKPRCVDSVDVLLKRRTLQIQSGSARYDYSHGILNSNLLNNRRVSITFRESPL